MFILASAGVFYVVIVPNGELRHSHTRTLERKDSLASGFGHLLSIRLEDDSTISECIYDASQHALVRYVFRKDSLVFIQMVGFETGMSVKYRAHIDMEKSLLWQRKRVQPELDELYTQAIGSNRLANTW